MGTVQSGDFKSMKRSLLSVTLFEEMPHPTTMVHSFSDVITRANQQSFCFSCIIATCIHDDQVLARLFGELHNADLCTEYFLERVGRQKDRWRKKARDFSAR